MAKRNNLLIFILTIGVFGILNTEMGVIGILPSISEHFHVSISKAGWLVSLFTLVVAVSGPTMPLLFSGINRKKVMLLVLGVYGGANIIGSIVAGKLLTKNAIKSIVTFPFALGAVYIILFFTGQFTVTMAIITLIWGILSGIGANITQYWIMSAAPEAPDFANGLFLTAANLGTTFGVAVGGLFISEMGTQYVVLVGILSLILSLVTILLRNYMYSPTKQLSA